MAAVLLARLAMKQLPRPSIRIFFLIVACACTVSATLYLNSTVSILIIMITGVFTSLVSVLERSVPVPDGTTHWSPLASSLLHIISSLISHSNEMYVLYCV